MNATVRTVGRDVLAGLIVVGTQFEQGTPWLRALVQGGLTTGAMLLAEVFTPLNAVVGPGKTQAVVPDAIAAAVKQGTLADVSVLPAGGELPK